MTDNWKVAAPVDTFTGEVAGCAFANGRYEGPASIGVLNYFMGAGYTVEPVDDRLDGVEAEAPADAPAVLPAKSAAKADWVEAAVRRALAEQPNVDEAEARAAAEANTKEQLIELLTATTEEQTA